MRSVFLAITLMFIASVSNAQSLDRRAAEIFENACLSDIVIALDSGSSVGAGAAAAQQVGEVFLSYDRQGKSRNLNGTPRYSVSADRRVGRFTCYVTSKDLTARRLVRHFDRLSRIAANGTSMPAITPAQVDDAPHIPAEGNRRVFISEGRELLLEAIHFQSERGPVGSFFISLEHRIGS